VTIVPKEQVSLAFHFPPSRQAPPSANVYKLRAMGETQTLDELVGTVRKGETLHLKGTAGSRYKAYDGARRLLLEVAAGYEEEQHYELTSALKRTIDLELAPSVSADVAVHVYWIDDTDTAPDEEKAADGATIGTGNIGSVGREHFQAELTSAPGGARTIRVSSVAGERWIVRRRSEGYEPGETLLELTVADAPQVQHHTIVAPPLRA